MRIFLLTGYIQGLCVLAFPNVVVDLALYDGIVKIAGRVVDDHLRGVVPDDLLLVDKPPGRRQRNRIGR